MHPIIAGPVFTEWYWGPIFIALFVGVPLLVAALVFDGLVTFVLRRRGGGPRSTPAHFKTAGAFALTGALMLYGSFVYREHREDRDRIDRALAAITFPLFEPAPLPAGFRVLWVYPTESGTHGVPELVGTYSGPGGTLAMTQQASEASGGEAVADRCVAAPRRPGGAIEYYPLSCRPRPTPGGRSASDDGHEIVTRLGATDVKLAYDSGLPRAELERLIDALREKPEAEVRLIGPD